MENLNVVLFDLETSGLGFASGIVEVAFSSFKISDLENVNHIEVNTGLVNPGMEISPRATTIHGITNDDVMFSPNIEKFWVQSGMQDAFKNADLISGFNIDKFDIPMLNANLSRAGIEDAIDSKSLDVMTIYRTLTGNRKGTLTEACEAYGVKHEIQHRAKGDVVATMGLLSALIKKHGLELVLGADEHIVVSKDIVEVSKQYRDIKLEIETLEKSLKQVKTSLLEMVGDEDVETPYIKISTNKGRKMVDYKKLVLDLGLDQDEEEMAKYIKQSNPSRVIRLV